MSKLVQFDVSTHAYKIVNGHSILVDVWIPKNTIAGSRPLIIRLHGGYLVTGSRDFEPWTPKWLLDYAILQSAVIISGDYRLMPEATGSDIIEDVEDLYKWAHDVLPEIVVNKTQNHSAINLNRVLAVGDSAGGYLAIQLGINHGPSKEPVGIRGVIAAYPMIGWRDSAYSSAKDESAFPPDTKIFGATFIEEYLQRVGPEAVASSAIPPDRAYFAHTAVCHGQLQGLLLRTKNNETERQLIPEERLAAGEKLPPIFILHGAEDNAIPVKASINFVDILRNTGHSESDLYIATPSGDHGFDETVTLQDEWMQEGLKMINNAWLK